MANITLYFENDTEKNYFLGQLSDGFGENFVSITPVSPLGLRELPKADGWLYNYHNFYIINERDPYGEYEDVDTILLTYEDMSGVFHVIKEDSDTRGYDVSFDVTNEEREQDADNSD